MTSGLLGGAVRAVPRGVVATAKHLDTVDIVALAVAAALVVVGVRSLVHWQRKGFRPASTGETVLYALHVTARVGMWFAFAGLFAGYALVDDPQAFRWYVMVPLALAAIQFATAVVLGQDRPNPHGPDG